jgi:hypothetical protein
MLKLIARIIAKQQYIFKLEHEGATNEINAQLAQNRAQEKRLYIEQLNKEADAIEENIATEEARLEKGFWECENGHEFDGTENAMILPGKPPQDLKKCFHCGSDIKFIQLTRMTGQEKYEAEKEKDEARKIAGEKRRVAIEEANQCFRGREDGAVFPQYGAEQARGGSLRK